MWDVDMADWFTVETIDKCTFAISEYKHWEETHCYLICGAEKAVLIDTGLGIGNIKLVVDSPQKNLYLMITRFSRGCHSRFYMTGIVWI